MMNAPTETSTAALNLAPMATTIGQACALQLGPHWKTEGRLTLVSGMVTIVNGAGKGWETKLRKLGLEVSRLDEDTIAIKAPRSS